MASESNKNIATGLLEVLHHIRDRLIEEIGDDFRLILFGSYARGEAGPDSDVDLMVVLPDEEYESFETRERVRDAVYGFSITTEYLFSLLLVSESQAREQSGFKVFGAVEREGVPI